MKTDLTDVLKKYECITNALISRGLSITTMESCTSGSIASLITDTEGSSAVMKGAFVTYSNEAKIRCGVPESVIAEYGVYSPQTAAEMASACRSFYGADIGIGITGSFGNADPANGDSVPGKVYFAISYGVSAAEKTEENKAASAEHKAAIESCEYGRCDVPAAGAEEAEKQKTEKPGPEVEVENIVTCTLDIAPGPDRFGYKMIAADAVADGLMDILELKD